MKLANEKALSIPADAHRNHPGTNVAKEYTVVLFALCALEVFLKGVGVSARGTEGGGLRHGFISQSLGGAFSIGFERGGKLCVRVCREKSRKIEQIIGGRKIVVKVIF